MQISQENTCVGISFQWSCRTLDLQLYEKEKLQHRYFPMKLAKFLRTLFHRTPQVTASEHWKLGILRMCSSDKMIPLQSDITSIFICLIKVWSMLHHGSVGWVQNKECFLASFCSWRIIKFLRQNNNQSKTGLGSSKLLLELCGKKKTCPNTEFFLKKLRIYTFFTKWTQNLPRTSQLKTTQDNNG